MYPFHWQNRPNLMVPTELPCMIHRDGFTNLYMNKIQVLPDRFIFNNSKKPIYFWNEFGMKLQWNGPIVEFIMKHLPKGTTLVGYTSDYNFALPESFKQHHGKVLQIVRYYGVPDSIIVPGDDLFFVNPAAYLPREITPFDEKPHEIFWRGSCTGLRRKDVVMALDDIPGCNVKLIKCHNHEEDYWNSMPIKYYGERVSPDEYSKRTIWLSVEGFGCASDTTRALMSGCAVIYFRQTKPWFDCFLKNEENCIIVEDDVELLKTYAIRMLEDKEFTKKIAENGKATADRIFRKEVYEKFILDQLI